MVNPSAGQKGAPLRTAVQRRTVIVLCAAQLLSGIMNGVALTVSPLLAVDLTGSLALAGMPVTTLAVAAALTAQPLAALALKRGRRVALTGGLLVGALGSATMMIAPLWRSFPVLLAGAGLIGVASATQFQARFAATDLATGATRARDLAWVMWAITPGAVVGPNLVSPGSSLGTSIGLAPLTGAFLFAILGLLTGAVVLFVGLRPDPLLLAQHAQDSADVPGEQTSRASFVAGLAAIRTSPRAVLGVATVIAVQLLVVTIVSGTPVHLRVLAERTPGHGGLAALAGIGLGMSLYLAGSYLFSPAVGWFADRSGPLPVALSAFGFLALAMVIAGFGGGSEPAVTVGLVLLGIGWSMGFIAGSALVSESVGIEQRIPVQGVTDSLTAVAAAVGAASAGLALVMLGFMTLNLIALVVASLMALWHLSALRELRKQEVTSR